MSRARRRPLLLVAVVVLLVAGGEFAAAQDAARQQASALASQLMSPFCPGRLLVDCTSSQAYELHDILGAPATHGVGLLAWLVPGVLGLTTLAGVAWKVLAAARARPAAPCAPAPAGLAGALAFLDEELRDLD